MRSLGLVQGHHKLERKGSLRHMLRAGAAFLLQKSDCTWDWLSDEIYVRSFTFYVVVEEGEEEEDGGKGIKIVKA